MSRRPKFAAGFVRLLCVLAFAMVGACASRPPLEPLPQVADAPAPTLPDKIPDFAGPEPDIVAADQIYSLPPEEAQDFLSYYHDPRYRHFSASKRIARYLKEATNAFEYRPETRTATEVTLESGGNCLSLANLTTAVARLAGVEVDYQLITDLPIFEKDNDIILRSIHVRSKLTDPPPELTAMSRERDSYPRYERAGPRYQRTGVIIDYFPSGSGRFIRNISEAEFSAMHYRNLAAEAIAAGDFGRAYWLVKKAMNLVPEDGNALNMMAILYRRNGDEETAEQVYRYGIEYAEHRLALLKNYRLLLRDQGRDEEAAAIDRIVKQMNDRDPFEWWFLAEDAYAQENYADALSYYKRAVGIAPYLHEGYFGMAKSYYQLGEINKAKEAMRNAMKNAARRNLRGIYQAKLDALSGKGRESALADIGK